MKAILISGLICLASALHAAEAELGDWDKLASKLSVEPVQRLARSGETNARAKAVDEALSRATSRRIP